MLIFTMFCYTIFHLGQGLATNFGTLIVTRFFGGVFAVAPITNSGGESSEENVLKYVL